VNIQLDSGDVPVKAKLEARDAQQVALIAENHPAAENTEAIPLTRVVYINPLPEETSNGVNCRGRLLTKNIYLRGQMVKEH
jgi:hypothetical protein